MSKDKMDYVKKLRCRECHREYDAAAIYICEFCFGPLEVVYDYEKIGKVLNRKEIEKREKNIWRYRELLPVSNVPETGFNTGFTPFFRAYNLGEVLGVKKLYIKDDSVNHPTLSFKDRVVAIASSKAKDFGFNVIACASTGNLANAVSSFAAKFRMPAFIFIPADLEPTKIAASAVYKPNIIAINGNYDQVNRLCTEISHKYKWGFVNINLRPFYAEGSKSYGYEIAEQFGWIAPDNIVVPVASGSLITKIYKGLKEFEMLGIIPEVKTKLYVAQADGCSPVSKAIKENSKVIKPVKPDTIARSIAIGNPADGYYAMDIVKTTGGWAADVTDEEVVEGIKLLAETEGIFSETAGGVTVAATKKLIEKGKIKRNESIVISITGNGLKTQEVISNKTVKPYYIKPNLSEFEDVLKRINF